MSDLELNRLLEVLDRAEKKKERLVKRQDKNSVERFISDLNLKTGLELVPTYVIFYTYKKKWKDTNKEKKLNKIVFFRAFNKHFTQIRTNKQRYYLLDSSSFDMTREGIIEAKQYNKGLKK